jgi:hypothetical protein
MKALKSISIVLVVLIIIIALFISLSKKQQMVVVLENNLEKKPLTIVLNHFQDSDCGMVIDELGYASQVIAPDGKTWFFHDHGGMVKWLSRSAFEKEAIIWVHALESNRWIDGRKAYYSRDEKTPMEYGFGAYAMQRDDLITFEEMKIFTLRGETMANPTIRKQLLKRKKERDGNR